MQVERIQTPRGLDLVSSQETMSSASAPVITNLLAHRTGKLVQRGGITSVATHTSAPLSESLSGPWAFNEALLFGQPDNAGVAKLHKVVFNADGTLTLSAPAGGPSTLAHGYARVAGQLYGNSRTGSNYLWKWDGAAAFTELTNGPSTAVDVAEFLSRVLVLGGSPAGGGAASNDILYWSDTLGPVGNTLAEWQDDVSGLTNKLTLPDTGVALAPVGQSIAVLCKGSVHLLSGSSPSSWSRRQVLQRGCTNTEAVASLGDSIYFLSDEGLFEFDGAQEQKVSAPIELSVVKQSRIKTYGRVSKLGNDYLYVAVYTGSLSGTLRFAGLYHTPSGTWTSFTSSLLDGGVPAMVYGWNDHAAMLDKFDVCDASDITSPTGAAGGDSTGAADFPIAVAWTTRTLRLSTPVEKSAVRRVIVDYVLNVSALSIFSLAYTVYTSPQDYGGTPTAMASGTLSPSATSDSTRRRAVIDVNGEAEDLWIELTSINSDLATGFYELLDVWVVYDKAQQSRGY